MENKPLSVLEYLRKMLNNRLSADDVTHMNYPTAISQLLKFELLDVAEGCATLGLNADAAIHGNQQGTVHGGMLCELADAAIGTAHSTLMAPGESFTSIDLKATFFKAGLAGQINGEGVSRCTKATPLAITAARFKKKTGKWRR
ncbi:Uncharacterized protein, possibly involved in aromatic compounds catabolism [Cedecea neteri]|uniref:Uncharacterized protein, possibly involved in aromatic compounds catabolism n=1 Tax=Cedecea neteri TaxID=158822 RepID=A0A2X3IED8_9ENTR|nr:Uncharacterized protein, possibly involved in aromatic compounds catabolism [Cedecea neteri]